MIVSIRSGEWSQWAGGQDEEYFARLLNGFGWRIAIRNADFERVQLPGDAEEAAPQQQTQMSVDAVATFFDPVRQSLDAVFIESKRRANRPSEDEVKNWVEKCRRAQDFVEESQDMQRLLCDGEELESVPCTKSILFLDCENWRDIWGSSLADVLPIQRRTAGGPRRVLIVDRQRALWLQHSLDLLGTLRNAQNQAPEGFLVYHWKRGFHANLSFDQILSEVKLFLVAYPGDAARDLVLVTYEPVTVDVATYYADHLTDMLDAGAFAFRHVFVYLSYPLEQHENDVVERVIRDRLQRLRVDIGVTVRVKTLPTGLNR